MTGVGFSGDQKRGVFAALIDSDRAPRGADSAQCRTEQCEDDWALNVPPVWWTDLQNLHAQLRVRPAVTCRPQPIPPFPSRLQLSRPPCYRRPLTTTMMEMRTILVWRTHETLAYDDNGRDSDEVRGDVIDFLDDSRQRHQYTRRSARSGSQRSPAKTPNESRRRRRRWPSRAQCLWHSDADNTEIGTGNSASSIVRRRFLYALSQQTRCYCRQY